jgi:hypothetical protein
MRAAQPVGAGFALRDGALLDTSPYLFVADTTERSGRGWSGAVLILAEPVDRAPGDARLAADTIAGVRRTVDGIDASDAIAALCAAFGVANARLLAENRRRGTCRRLFLGLSVVVTCGDDLFIAQVPPGQILIRQPESLFACPALASWQPDFEPEVTYELPNPLGLRAELQPRVFYSRVSPRHLAIAVSSRVAARLGVREHDLVGAGSVADTLALILDSCGRGGVAAGYGAVAALSGSPQRTVRELLAAGGRRRAPGTGQESSHSSAVVDRQAPTRQSVPRRRLIRNWHVRPLDRNPMNVQTESAQDWAFAWLGSTGPGHPGSGCAMGADETAELPALSLDPGRA